MTDDHERPDGQDGGNLMASKPSCQHCYHSKPRADCREAVPAYRNLETRCCKCGMLGARSALSAQR